MKTKIFNLFLFLTLTCFSMSSANFIKEYMNFKGTVGTESIRGGLAITESKTYGTFTYFNSKTNPMYDLRCTSNKSLGNGKYKLNFNVELDGKKYGTWSITFNAKTRKITGTMKDENGKTLNINLTEWTLR